MCEELNSVPALFIHLAQLHLIFYRLEVNKGTEPVGKGKVNCSKFTKKQIISTGCDYIFNFSDWRGDSLPVHLDHIYGSLFWASVQSLELLPPMEGPDWYK